jgi:hypothetical protein
MSEPQAKRHNRTEQAAQPLQSTEIIIKLVLSFVGRGQYLYVGGINRVWRMLYMKSYPDSPPTTKTTCPEVHEYKREVISGKSVFGTTYRSAFGSEARLQLAFFSHLPVQLEAVARAAGEAGSKYTINAAWTNYLFNNRPPGNVGNWPVVCSGAASAGRLDTLRWLVQGKGIPCNFDELVSIAFKRGDLELLQFSFSVAGADYAVYSMSADNCSLIREAGACSNLSLLTWLSTQGCFDVGTVNKLEHLAEGALEHKCLSTIKWLKRRGALKYKDWWLGTAALQADVPMFRFLVEAGCRVVSHLHDDDLHVCCALGGSVELLTTVQAAYGTSAATDAVLYNDLVAYAGMMGHVDVVKHLLEQGALWPSTLWHANVLPYHNMVAAETQCWSLPALQYAISAGCPWGDWPYGVCSELIACGYAAEISWAHANGCPCGTDCPAR